MKSWLLTVFIGIGSINTSAMEIPAEDDYVMSILSEMSAEEKEAMDILKDIKDITPDKIAMVVANLAYYEKIWLKILRQEVVYEYRVNFPDKDHNIFGLIFVYNDILKILSQSVISIAGAFCTDDQYNELSDTRYWKIFKVGRQYATKDQNFLNKIFNNLEGLETYFFITKNIGNFETIKQSVSDALVFKIHELGLLRFSGPILQDFLKFIQPLDHLINGLLEIFPTLDHSKTSYKDILTNADNQKKYEEIISYAKIYTFAAAFNSHNIPTFIEETKDYRSIMESSKNIFLTKYVDMNGKLANDNNNMNVYVDSLRQMLIETWNRWHKWTGREMPESKKSKRTDSPTNNTDNDDKKS